jgi:hypothetical protein
MPSMVPAAIPPVSWRRPSCVLTTLLVAVRPIRLKVEPDAIGAIDVAITAPEQTIAARAVPSQVVRVVLTDRALPPALGIEACFVAMLPVG